MRLVFCLFIVLIAACDRGPAVPSAAENQALDEAANQLDEAPRRLDAIDDSELNVPDTARAAPEGTAPPDRNGRESSAGER